MKKLTLLVVIICSMSLFAEQKNGIVYVKAGASGTGASWSDAMGDIQLAINQAKVNSAARQDVWVAAGNFVITTCINMVDSVNVYGSFAGTETDPSQRAKVANGKAWDFANPTNLTGSGARIVQTTSAFDMETVVDGFIMTGGNGNGTTTPGAGGAAQLRPNMALQNCIVMNNTSLINSGGGVGMYPGGTIRYCLVKNNVQAVGTSGGGGINVNCSSPYISYIQNCEITGNSSTVRGGAMNIQGTGMTYVSNNKIYNNTAMDATSVLKGGGALYLGASQVANNLIYNNTGGTVVYILGGTMYNNTIVKNVGAVYMAGGVNNLSNNIVWGCATDNTNTTPTSIGGVVSATFTVNNNATYNPVSTTNGWIIANNIQFSSNITNGDVSNPVAGTVGSGPKFNAVTDFIGATTDLTQLAEFAGVDWSLQSASPCVNTGMNITAVPALATDFTGTVRPQGYPSSSALSDIGAYELPYYIVVAGEAATANGAIYSSLGVLLPENYTNGYAKGSTVEFLFQPNAGHTLYSAKYINSTDGGLTFTGTSTDFTSQIGADGFWTGTINSSFKISVVWDKPNALKELSSDKIKCLVSSNGVNITGLSSGDLVSVYGVNGILVKLSKVINNELYIPLVKGVYVLRVADTAKKLIIR